MGKFYAIHDKNLYIYVTDNDVMIDLNLFPEELSLFDAESSWMIRDKMAVSYEADKDDIEKAETFLSLNSFQRVDYPEEVLKYYYTIGDDSVLGNSGERRDTH